MQSGRQRIWLSRAAKAGSYKGRECWASKQRPGSWLRSGSHATAPFSRNETEGSQYLPLPRVTLPCLAMMMKCREVEAGSAADSTPHVPQ